MKTIRVHDKEFSLNITRDEIGRAVQQLADSISRDYQDKEPLFLVILNGSFIFAADLFRRMIIDPEISFVKFSSYEGTSSTGYVKQLIGLGNELDGRDVVVVEDIVDTGITMEMLLGQLEDRKVNSVRIATLLYKPEAFQKEYKVDYVGLEIPNDFIVGYGLDYNGLGRGYDQIYKIVE